MLVAAASRAGPSHRARSLPCQDAYSVEEAVGRDRTVAAVGDGLGSRRLSHEGSQAATKAAVTSLLAARRLGPKALHRAFVAARTAVRRRAKELGAPVSDLATTLHVAVATAGRVYAASVGDGAVVASRDGQARIVLGPGDGEYANEVVPLTASEWKDHFRVGVESAATNVFVFTDGLTRLLLTRGRGSWQPFAPFFESFLPRVDPRRFDPFVVQRFLDTDSVDRAWDDDKCLVVIGLAPDSRR
ncbi:MAG: protein phosphatase 2C domain-containing protein [Euryarchaeota archaeon]|nr:protein phosphatase 2C domain-containing protein [Euryarchaeota archaeon]